MSKTQTQYKELFGREWRQRLKEDAMLVSLAGCGKNSCLDEVKHGPRLCRICSATVTRFLLALSE